MSENQLLETLGRKQLQIESQDAAYTNLLNLLAGVVTGQIDPARILINVTDRTWTVAKDGERPSMPAQINGLPLCVVAPERKSPLEMVAEAVKAAV